MKATKTKPKSNQPRRKRCESCRLLKADAERTIDPYAEDIYGVKTPITLCGACYSAFVADI